jgi:DNA-binding transcriptional ArsR family regulator
MSSRVSPGEVKLHHKAGLLQGLSVVNRLLLLELLRDGPACVSDLVDQTALTRPNVPIHLACLRDCGLVETQPQGRFVFYSLGDNNVADLLTQLDRLAQCAGPQIEACPRFEALLELEE